MAELKKCPFCGSDKLKIEKKKKETRYFGIGALENYTASVRCNVCHARGGAVSGYVRNRRFVEADNWLKDEISIEAWNKRATGAEIRNKAIDEFAEKLKWEYENSIGIPQREINFANAVIDQVAERLKERE